MKLARNNIVLHGDGSHRDFITIDNCDRKLIELEGYYNGGKGANSFVFQAIDPQENEDDLVIKFCRFYSPTNSPRYKKAIERFEREINALCLVNNSASKDRVVKIMADGTHLIGGKVFRYYVMEKADLDLKRFLTDNPLSLQQKILLCLELSKSIKSLHDLNIYHRDIKPDNIFIIDQLPKIGDLGLINFRDEDSDIDDKFEKIGPIGFFSPEAKNKFLGDRDRAEFNFDTIIDDRSDVFQLGKVFWYILQGEVPSGQLTFDDLRIGGRKVFNLILWPMLQYKKTRRPHIGELEPLFIEVCSELAI